MDMAINYLIVKSNMDERKYKGDLEIEESGRVLANLQGKVSGHRKFIAFLTDRFNLSPHVTQDSGESESIEDFDDPHLYALQISIADMQSRQEWRYFINDVDTEISILKNNLLYSAEKSRDLDIAQGTYQGLTFYNEAIRNVTREIERREEKAKKEREQPGLF
jgi:hypothetical protein